MNIYTIGLTGGIGCGKSSVLSFFSALGWKTVDADQICHDLYEDSDSGIMELLSSRWGASILDKNRRISRKAVAEVVFNDEKELAWLNSVIHPEIYRIAGEELEKFGGPAIFDVPLLFESGRRDFFNKIITVWTCREIQFKRLKAAGMEEEQVRQRVRRQFSNDDKLEMADYGIINNGTMEYLNAQCLTLSNALKDELSKISK